MWWSLGVCPFLLPAGGYQAVEWIGNSVPPRFMQAIAEHVQDYILSPARQNVIHEEETPTREETPYARELVD